jgi:hypothetical protein
MAAMRCTSASPFLLRAPALILAPMAIALAFGCSAGADEPSGSAGPGSGGSGGAGNGNGNGGNTAGITVNGSTGAFNGDVCGEEAYGNAVPASVLITLDKSGSMAGGEGQPDKWAPTAAAITQLTQTAPQELNVGLHPFPAGDCDWTGLECSNLQSPQCQQALADGCCEDVSPAPAVMVAPLSTSGAAITTWLSGNGPEGGTPTLWALKRSYAVMQTIDVEGERFVLLVTDGEPNTYAPEMNISTGISFPESNIECKTLGDIEAEVAAAANGTPPVKTFVIGSPGSEGAADFLSRCAVAGQTAPAGCNPAAGDCHFQIGTADYQADLQAALDQIAGVISDCIFALPEGEEVDPSKVNVVIETPDGPVDVFRDTAHLDGWDYTDATQTKIQLFGPPCELYQSLAGNRVVIVLGCETIVK